MQAIFLSIHVIACFLMILFVLLQPSKGGGFAGFGGGGGGDNLYSAPSGTSFLRTITIVLAGTFAATSLILTILSTRPGLQSVIFSNPAPASQQAPQTPGPAPEGEKPAPGPAIGQIPAETPAAEKKAE